MGKYSFRKKLGLFAAIPLFFCILFLPTPNGLTQEGHSTLAIAFLMAFWWITEAIPLPATALIPLALFPILKISTAQDVALAYGHHFIFLFMGGFLIAIAMQKCNLHKRIALYIIRFIGTTPNKIILGFMCATAFLSMWISNTATTMMMFPVAMAVSSQIKVSSSFSTALMLGIAYSASIGGVGTLIGTPPNIVFAGAIKSLFPEAGEIGYFQWMLIGIPFVIFFIPIVWYYLTHIVFPITIKEIPGGDRLINEHIKTLGKLSKGEVYVSILSILTAFGWILRKDILLGTIHIPGWTNILGIEKYVHDSTIAMFTAILMFIIPVNLKKNDFLLNWEWAKKIPWGVLVLFGGGIALANAFKVSGLAKWIGEGLGNVSDLPLLLIIIITSLLITFLTEITSNTATSTIFMPILASTAIAVNIHPYLLMIPATLSASCAFMLPVATPPNAIVFSSGFVTAPQMAKAGFILNFISIILITIIIITVVIPVFNISFSEIPEWVIP